MPKFRTITVAGVDALSELDRFRTEIPASGLWPILLGNSEDLADRWDEEDHPSIDAVGATSSPDLDQAAAILAEAAIIDPSKWFRDRGDEVQRDTEGWAQENVDFQPEDDPLVPEAEWPTAPEDEMGIVTHCDSLTKEPFAAVVIGLFAVSQPWEVFAHLAFGGWNNCPAPAVQCAVHRFWAEQYGCQVVSIAGDKVQCLVAHPPDDQAAARTLAREQYFYCGDIVDQGTETVDNLAVGLWHSQTWYFWWD